MVPREAADTKRFLTMWVSPGEHMRMRRSTAMDRARIAAEILGVTVDRLLEMLEEQGADLSARTAPDEALLIRRIAVSAAA